MNDIVIRQDNLPDNIKDLSQFVLVGREKLVSVRAEIRAIDKLNLAQEVRDQKKEECSMLSEALLDAEVKIGDLLKQIPKGSGGDRKSIKIKNDTSVDFEIEKSKPKHQVIKDLGFNQKQAERFETLANNKDLVEQVKQEAKENDDIPTRTRVMELAKIRKQKEQQEQDKENNYNAYIDECKKVSNKFNDVLYNLNLLNTDDDNLSKWKELLDESTVESYLNLVNENVPKLLKIQRFLKGVNM